MQVVVTVAPPGSPTSPNAPVVGQTPRANLDGLIAQRSELERQLEQMTNRRRELQRQRDNTSNEGLGKSIDGRLVAMDARTAKIEDQLAQVNDQVAAVMATGVTSSRQNLTYLTSDQRFARDIESRVEDGVAQGMMIGASSILGVYLVWRGFRRFVLRRKPKPAPAIPDHSAQLMALQQSMDTIAIEVERISEAQRFSAKLLKEKVRVE